MTSSTRGRGGAMLSGAPRRKGAAAIAADLYSTHSGFRFLINFIFFGWLTLLCLAFSSNLGGQGGIALPGFQLSSAWAPHMAAPEAQAASDAPTVPLAPDSKAPDSKASVLAQALGDGAEAAPILSDYRIQPATPGEPEGARAQMMAGAAALARGGTAETEAGFVKLKTAADAGLPAAMALYGLARLAPPAAVPADASAGREWLQRAAQAGDAQAARLLARAYLTGSAGFAAPDKARELFRRGHDLGDSASSLALARLLARGIGGPADAAGAEQIARLAADRGDGPAMAALGRYLTQAAVKGWSPSFDEAILWLTRAAGRGDMSAAEGLGDIQMFLAKAAPAQDPAKGFGWYQRCAEAGRTACHFAVGRAYALAVGTAGDLPQAWAHLALARDSGHPKAAEALNGVEARMTPAQHAEGVRLLGQLSVNRR